MLSKVILLLVAGLGLHVARGWVLEVDSHQAECVWEIALLGDKVGLEFQVVEGGFLDVDVTVNGPDGKVLYSGTRETSGKFAFNAHQVSVHPSFLSNGLITSLVYCRLFHLFHT